MFLRKTECKVLVLGCWSDSYSAILADELSFLLNHPDFFPHNVFINYTNLGVIIFTNLL